MPIVQSDLQGSRCRLEALEKADKESDEGLFRRSLRSSLQGTVPEQEDKIR
jgi:hypothetical protein